MMALLHSELAYSKQPTHKWSFASGALACGLILFSSAVGAVPPPHKVSGLSPFASCVADKIWTQSGTNFPEAEVGPSIDANPRSPQNLIAVWQQDVWSTEGARGLVAGVSIDGGQTWARVVPPGFSKCSGGAYERANEPWITFSPSGTAYFIGRAHDQDRPDLGYGPNAILVSRSTNGGYFWSQPTILISETNGQISDEKPNITADPYDPRYIYAAWQRNRIFFQPERPLDRRASNAATQAGEVEVRLERDAVPVFAKGPTVFTRTANEGLSWEAPRIIYDPGPNNQTIHNSVEVLPDGTVVVFFTNMAFDVSTGSLTTNIGLIKSTNKGRTFGQPTLPVSTELALTGTLSPDSRETVRDATGLYDSAVDPQNGNLYLVWQDNRFGNVEKVAFSMSANGGATWSNPIQVAMTPTSAQRLHNQSFIPSVEVGANHQIAVTYYDFRNDQNDGRELVDYFAVFCTPSAVIDCTKRRNWGDGATAFKDNRLTAQSFDIRAAPNAFGYFLGDYMGLVRGRSVVQPAFGLVDNPNKTSIYTNSIRPLKSAISAQ